MARTTEKAAHTDDMCDGDGSSAGVKRQQENWQAEEEEEGDDDNDEIMPDSGTIDTQLLDGRRREQVLRGQVNKGSGIYQKYEYAKAIHPNLLAGNTKQRISF